MEMWLWGVSRSTEIHRRSEVPVRTHWWRARTGEVLGFNLASGTTVFAFDGEITTFGAEVPAIFSFFVPQEATGGLHTLTVTTEEGQDAASVLVLAAPPVIHEVLPTSPKLGELVVVDGKHLEQVETVFVGDTEQVLASKDLGAVTFYLSPDTELGSQNLEVISPTGSASVLVSVLLPPPSLVKVSPNPATVGGIGGYRRVYGERESGLHRGDQFSDPGSGRENSVKVLVNGDTPVGQHMVSVTAEGGTSASFGPISVLPPVKDGFGVSELLPASAAPGQEIFVRGEKLDIVSEVWVNGVVAEWSSEGDKERRLRIPETSAGETEMQFFGPDQVVADFFTVLENNPTIPQLDAIPEGPVEWGESWTIKWNGSCGCVPNLDWKDASCSRDVHGYQLLAASSRRNRWRTPARGCDCGRSLQRGGGLHRFERCHRGGALGERAGLGGGAR